MIYYYQSQMMEGGGVGLGGREEELKNEGVFALP